MLESQQEKVTVLFDGYCNLCSRLIDFIIAHDRNHDLALVPLQSEKGMELQDEFQSAQSVPESIVLIENGRSYYKSTAALKILRKLRTPFKILLVFSILPRPLRDVVYEFVARKRYRWFGKRDSCRVMDQKEEKH